MIVNMRNVESVYLAAVSRFEAWREKFERDFYEDIVNSQIDIGRHYINNLPEDVKNMSRANNPDAWKLIENE